VKDFDFQWNEYASVATLHNLEDLAAEPKKSGSSKLFRPVLDSGIPALIDFIWPQGFDPDQNVIDFLICQYPCPAGHTSFPRRAAI